MLFYGASPSLDLNWLLRLFGLAEKGTTISDHSNTQTWLLLFVILAIVIGLGLHLHQLAGNRESNPTASEVVDQSLKAGEQEHPSGELDHYFDGGHQIRRRTATYGGTVRRHGSCAFCGSLSTTRCSRCKAARYCSVECQIRHWRSEHKYECSETDTEADQSRAVHVREASLLGNKSGKESTSDGSHGEAVNQSSDVGVDLFNGSDVSSFHGCQMCGRPSTTRCSRCKAIRYCSVKCLIMDWKWHKVHCIARDVNSFPTERPHGDVGMLNNSCEEEENIHLSGPLSLELYPERTTNFKSPIEGSQDPTKEVQENRTEWMRYLENEVAKSRNEIQVLQLERDKWMMRANVARERFHSLRKESEHQLFVLRNENESISDAERQACNVIHILNERLHHLQSALVEVKKELQEEQKRYQCLRIEYDKSQEIAQIAMRDVQVVRQELQEERERVQLLTEKFLRDVTSAESRAAFAEAKLSDLHKKIRSKDYKVAVWTDNLGRPAMACVVCLTKEKDLAFGCGHMTCRDCGSKLSKCPICREQITSHIRLFPG